MEFGVHSVLHRNCHHLIIYAKFTLKIYLTNIDVNKKMKLFNKTIKNIILNYIPYQTIIL